MSIAGLLIRRERLARAWSQEGLCRGICGTSYLSKIEQGKAAASEEILALLLARLGLSWTNDEDGALRAKTETCMEALFSGDASAFDAAFARLRAQESTLLCSPCAADYLLLRAFSCKKDGERHPLDTEFVPFLDQRQLALQRVLEGRHEEAALLYPAAAIRLWQGAHLYARGRYAAATEALRAAGEDFRLLLLSDHMTYMANGAHGADPVPFVLYDSRVSEGSGLPYSEANGRKGPYVDDGAELMDLLFELKKL